MYKIIDCLTQEHSYGLLAIATLVCVVGSLLSTIISRRLLTATGQRRKIQLFLSGLICGSIVWSTHFIAMLSYDPGIPHSYEPILTAATLGIAIIGTTLSNALLAYGARPWGYVAGGVCFGVTVSVMHYLGMSALQVPGVIQWNYIAVVASIALGTGFGMACYRRMLGPVTRFGWVSEWVLMVLAICTMHFTGMSAVTIQLNPIYEVPTQLLPESTLGLIIFAVTAVVLMIGFSATTIEINLERETFERILHSSCHDQLTGLPNRLNLSRHLMSYEEVMQADLKRQIGIITVDLNKFKDLNVVYGHAIGDNVLVMIAGRLQDACGPDDVVARTGGDEFVVLKKNASRDKEIRAFADRLLALVIEPIKIKDVTVKLTASIGIATSVTEGRRTDDLLQKSGFAMHRAKLDTHTEMAFYNAQMDEQDRDKNLLINDLRHAVDRGEFELVYQLQNDLKTLEPTGFEVLLRWNNPARGLISPGDFIPIAEETGMIREIGLWVLRTACFEAAGWPVPFSVAVNVAPQQLAQPSFLANLSAALSESGLAPNRLELEVTEAGIINDQEYTFSVMRKIRDLGVGIAMDDFGTGYSSLATLQAFPFDKIKIDRSFIKDVHVNLQRAAIVRSILLLGEAFEIPVLAEGVEEQEELDFLRHENCAAAQGFYFGKPLKRADARKIASNIDVQQAS